MQRDKLGGSVLIAGAILSVITMAIHPTGSDVVRDLAGQGLVSGVAHGLSLLAVPLLFYGLVTLTLRLTESGPLAGLALVIYGVGALAAIGALTANGFLSVDLLARAAESTEPAKSVIHEISHYNAAAGAFFAKVYVLGSAIAMLLWSSEIVRTRIFSAAVGYYGLMVSALTILLVGSGHLSVYNLHAFGVVVLGEAIWLVLVGAALRSSERS